MFKYPSGSEPRAEAGQDEEEDGESRAALLTALNEFFRRFKKVFIFCIQYVSRFRQCSKFW